jgi:hypothetical protein
MATSTRLCAAALVTILSIGPALAQTTTAPTTTAPSTRIDERDDDFNWGLLGLLVHEEGQPRQRPRRYATLNSVNA